MIAQLAQAGRRRTLSITDDLLVRECRVPNREGAKLYLADHIRQARHGRE